MKGENPGVIGDGSATLQPGLGPSSEAVYPPAETGPWSKKGEFHCGRSLSAPKSKVLAVNGAAIVLVKSSDSRQRCREFT